jgi:F-type H+-transporting ATPase subunit a
VSAMLAAGSGFEAPSTSDFWQPIFGTDGPFAITRASIVILLSVVLISSLLLAGTRRMAVVPGKGQYLTEVTYGMVRNGLGRDIIGSHDFLKFVPLLFSMFVLILVNNLFGVTPVVQFPTMSRIGFPAALTLVVFVIYHFVGIRAKGIGGHFKHMIPPGLPVAVLVLIVPLELLTYFFTRPVTLALRLFGNMFAGHLLLVLFASGGEYLVLHAHVLGYIPVGIFSYLMAFVMTVFELLVEFLQAYIFTLLAALYIAGSLADEH